MAIAIIYESEEWSNVYLKEYLESKANEVYFLNLEKKDFTMDCFDNVELLVNRIFPSSYFRNHKRTYFEGNDFMNKLNSNGIPMINSYEAFEYDFDKLLVCRDLKKFGINVPEVYCCSLDYSIDKIKFPCIIKPNRGGRSTYTYMVKDTDELYDILKTLPDVEFIFQEYIKSVDNYTLRVEVIDDSIFSAVKRSIDETGISSYHRGAEYEHILKLDDEIRKLAVDVTNYLNIKMGGIDIIQGTDGFYVIDVNATSNFSKKFVDFLGKNPIEKMGDVIIEEYMKIKESRYAS